MYAVNRRQIEERLDFLYALSATAERITAAWNPEDPVCKAALERVVHLAMEAVTDVGSCLIDGFIMRDAGSYEDIITVLREEGVIHTEQAEFCIRLVRQRKPLVQDYLNVDHGELLELADRFTGELDEFAQQVRAFIEKELS